MIEDEYAEPRRTTNSEEH